MNKKRHSTHSGDKLAPTGFGKVDDPANGFVTDQDGNIRNEETGRYDAGRVDPLPAKSEKKQGAILHTQKGKTGGYRAGTNQVNSSPDSVTPTTNQPSEAPKGGL